MVSYKQLGFTRSALLGYKNAVSDVRGPKHSERGVVAAAESGETEAARILHPE